MIQKVLLPIIAVAGVVFAIFVVKASNKPVPASQPVAQPAYAPFKSYIAGAGIVEAQSENVAIGTGQGGTVIDVFVKVGDKVKEHQPLFQIRNFTQQAELRQAKAALALAESKLKRLENAPRPEEIPPAQAKVSEAQAGLTDAKKQLELWESIYDKDKRAVSEDDIVRKRYAVQSAQALYDQAKANLTLLKAGTWKPDLDVARAEVESARSMVDVSEKELERLTIKAPIDGTVLQVKIHKGEYAMAGVPQTPLMVLGDIDKLVVRVDVDENDAWRFKPGADAVAFVRGNRQLTTPVKFLRVEPYVVPKKSLTGESTERVDTRVLQVLYTFSTHDLAVYVGQQMDVYIEAAPISTMNQAASAPATQKTP
jgi:multidrug efflux pump subunit AcrA (membrane-fusion protein)